MRLRAILFATVAFGAVGFGAYQIGVAGARHIERESREALTEALSAAPADWVRLRTNGLVVELSGEAPDEGSRLRALNIAREFVDPRRIRDLTSVSVANPIAPPKFTLELLRNEGEVSLIGLVPGEGGRGKITAGLDRAGLGTSVTDMLESADYPVPDGWDASLAFGLGILADLPRAKISVEPGKVGVIAVTETAAAREALLARLRAARPQGVELNLDISAPRPVISPFAVDFTYARGIGRFSRCSAESVADVVEIGVAARQVGFTGEPDCAIGLGAPSPQWSAAVIAGLRALRELGGGQFSIQDIDATLTGPEDVAPERLAAVGARLDAELPDVFSLSTEMPPRMVPSSNGQPVYAPRFMAVLRDDGTLRLDGSLQNATSRQAVDSYVASLFGPDRVVNSTVVDPRLPDGWPGRVLVGVAALSELREGQLEVTKDKVSLSGKVADAEADKRVSELLRAKLGDQAAVSITQTPPAAAQPAPTAAVTPPRACADEIAAILESGSIQFAAGSAEIEPDSKGVILAITDVMRGCPRSGFEIRGYTDSQGQEQENLRLSEARAAAVLAAIQGENLPDVTLTAKGLGEADPVADNGTEAGRARNRRIEFVPIPVVPKSSKAAEVKTP